MNIEKTWALCVKPHEAEKIRRILIDKRILRKDLRIKNENDTIYFPLRIKYENVDKSQIIETNFEKIFKKPKTYKEIIQIPHHVKNTIPTSFDVIGNIILIKLSDELIFYKKEIGEALLKVHRNIKTVCISKPVAGEYRIRDIEVVAGENKTKTIHKEYGLFYEIDLKKTYFSPRLANERKRISGLVREEETIIDMFTGVAPFPIMIANYSQPKIIFAIDKNIDAILFAKKNIKRNNVLDKIEVIHADSKKIYTKYKNKADRIIMNLPFSSKDYFIYALKMSKSKSLIHYYDILKEDEIQIRIDDLKEIAVSQGMYLDEFNIRKIKTYAPREFYIVIDITATKNADVA